ncbi:hypothetical protein [Aquimarina algiphila]|uniref:Uncharacterized protein n=1 Tax=Aquimarina algiphila TaxID=2047982 RepID=A0A554VNQ2_9FLAO|nr:hypothetical protein [Aquimarina algiphila]TSE10008.1 hypothetical protein FOF46_06820 [Aquimarina algiphila]
MKEIYLLIISVLLSGVIAVLGYFLKSVHAEVKTLLKELIEYTQELRNLISGIQVQIDKSIETDITEMKADVKGLYRKTEYNTKEILKLQHQPSKDA